MTQETTAWFVSQGGLGVACVLLVGAVIWLTKWARALISERFGEIGVLRDVVNGNTAALERVAEGMASIRGSVADSITIGGACKVLAEENARDLDRALDRIEALQRNLEEIARRGRP